MNDRCHPDDGNNESNDEFIVEIEKNLGIIQFGATGGKHGLDIANGVGEGIGPENNPTENNGQQGIPSPDKGREPLKKTGTNFRSLDNQKKAMVQAPDHKGPTGAMPEAAEKKNSDQVEIGTGRGSAGAAKWKVEIITKPGGQRDMPAPPKFPDGLGYIGIVEIFRKMKSKHPAKTNGHIRIPGKVIINLQGICQGPEPGQRSRQVMGRNRKEIVRTLAQDIGNQRLFGQSDNKTADTDGQVRAIGAPFMQPFCYIMVTDNGSGDELGKKRDIQGYVNGILLHLNFAAIQVNHIGHGLEGKKGNTNGQVNRRQMDRGYMKMDQDFI